VTWRCDYVGWDNSDPPQLWAWAGEYGDESSEPLFRLPADGLRAEWQQMKAEIEDLRRRIADPISDEQINAALDKIRGEACSALSKQRSAFDSARPHRVAELESFIYEALQKRMRGG